MRRPEHAESEPAPEVADQGRGGPCCPNHQRASPQATAPGRQAVGPLSALWYIVFVVPYFLWTPDAPRRPGASSAVATGLRELKRTLAALPSRRSLLAYLVSSMFYRDALGGMYVFGGIYAAGVLGWGMFEIGLFGALGLLGGVAGAWIGGRADSRFGPKPVIVATIVVVNGLLLHRHFYGAGRGPADRRGHAGGAVEPAGDRLLRLRRRHRGSGGTAPGRVANHAGVAGRRGSDDGGVWSFCSGRQGHLLRRSVPDRGGNGGERQPARRRHPDPVSVPRRVGGDGLGGRPGRDCRPAGSGIPAGAALRMRQPGRHVFRAAGNGAGRAAPCHAPPPAVAAGSPLRMEGGGR